MEVESQQPTTTNGTNKEAEIKRSKGLKRALLILSFALLILGGSCTPLLLRLYFLNGGSQKWLSSWLQTAGCPLILIPLAISYYSRRQNNYYDHDNDPQSRKLFLITVPLFVACTALGILIGIDDFLYAYGMSYLPVSTSSLLISTQLGFTSVFTFLLVKQKFSAYSINAVALLSFGAVVLGIHSNGDRPKGESERKYYIGFLMMVGAAALYGLVLPLVELMYQKAKQAITYTLVMEMQLVMGFFATVFCTVGMLLSKDLEVMGREPKEFKTGETSYYMVLIWSAIFSQFFYLGIVGVIHYGSALLAGIIIALLIPVTEVLAVIFFHESFNGGKGVALALSLWGFVSYFYGEIKANKKRNKDPPAVQQIVSDLTI